MGRRGRKAKKTATPRATSSPRPPVCPRLLICEGPDDKSFLHWLIRDRRIQDFILWDAHGHSKFDQALRSFQINRTREYNQLTDIVFVADNDDTPQWSFDNVCDQVRTVLGPRSVPLAPQQKSAGRPAISVLMIPWTGVHGHLESLCVDAAISANTTQATKTSNYLALSGSSSWSSVSREGKAWLTANLAIRCIPDPAIPLGLLFRKHRNLIPLSHHSFDRIAGFLNSV